MNVEQNKIIWLCKCDNKHGWLFIALSLPITLFADTLEFDTVEHAKLRIMVCLVNESVLGRILGGFEGYTCFVILNW